MGKSGKGHQVRKEGKGTGGWDDTKPTVEEADVQEEGDEKEDKPKKDEGKSEEELAAEAKAREEEQKQRELEEKQMTLEEYLEKQKKENAPAAALNIRTV